MPNSYQTHTANGSTIDFSFSQIDGWVNSGFIKVYVDDVLQTTGYTLQNLTGVNPLVRFSVAPANNKIITIRRETPATVSGFQGNIVDFSNGSVLTEEDLDNMAKGLLHIAQEADDTGSGALGPSIDGLNWNAENKRIQNLALPTAISDAATKGYVDGITLYGTGVATPQSWSFSGDGVTLSFTMNPVPASLDATMFLVEVGGVIQRPTVNYTINSPDVLTFTGAPPVGTNNIVVRNFGAARNIAEFGANVNFGANITAVGTVTAAGFSGPLTGTVQTAAQPNITSLGTLSSLTVSGDLTVDSGTLKVDSANNRVGIGITSPTTDGGSVLHIHSPSASSAAVHFTGQTTGTTSGDGLFVGYSSSGQAIVNNKENSGLGLYTNNNERLSIAANGAVFIPGNLSVTGTLSSGALSLSSLTLSTDLAVADGGTGASTTAAARTNLGLNPVRDPDYSHTANASYTQTIDVTGLPLGVPHVYRQRVGWTAAGSSTLTNSITFTISATEMLQYQVFTTTTNSATFPTNHVGSISDLGPSTVVDVQPTPGGLSHGIAAGASVTLGGSDSLSTNQYFYLAVVATRIS
jgi:hypothetical protein